MSSNSSLRVLILHLGILLASVGIICTIATSQTITADPEAEALRVIWQVKGGLAGGDEVGYAAGGLGDLFGTGKGVWAVCDGKLIQWRFYRNDSDSIAKDTVPFKTMDGYHPVPPVIGEFWGAGTRGMMMYAVTSDSIGDSLRYYQEFRVFRVESGSISDSIATMLDTRTMPSIVEIPIGSNGILAADLNHDGADELILSISGITRDSGHSYIPEIWIFKGGPEFSLDSPTVIARDTRKNDFLWWEMATGDFDGDGHVDIFLDGAGTPGVRSSRITFYWGNGTLEGFQDTTNRRTVVLDGDRPFSTFGATALDCDGDGVLDLAIDQRHNPDRGTYLFRSGTGKNARTRSYHRNDADIWFPDIMLHERGGYTNDSSRRYEMLQIRLLEGQTAYPGPMFFGGGDNGPDLAYDATSFFGGDPIFDVNGDGWDDLIAHNYTVNFNGGIAVIYAGGPYIPSPKVSGVESIAGEGHSQAITVWPNPLRDDLHIAWRGDLRRTPRSFRVHDILGREVAHGGVPPGTKAALWRSGDLPGGTYLLSVYAHDGGMITTTHIIKY